MKATKIQALVLTCAMLMPAEAALARTRHKHHYSRTRGTVIGAVVGAAVTHNKVKGALVGAALGNAVQEVRNKKQ